MSKKSLIKTFIGLTLLCGGFFCAQNAVCGQVNKIILIETAVTPANNLIKSGIISELADEAAHVVIETRIFEGISRDEETFWREIVKSNPSVIIAIGTPAARSAFTHVSQIPIVYTMTLGNFEELVPEQSAMEMHRSGGVSIMVPLVKQLEIMTNALPMIRRVGVLYTTALEDYYRDAVEFSKKIKIDMVGARVKTYKDVPPALKGILHNIDALIIPPDINIYQPEAIRFVLNTCYDEGVPVMAFSKQLAVAGAPLAVAPDYEDLGRQTAELIFQVLADKLHEQPLNQTPRSVILYLNQGSVTGMGLYFSREVLNSAKIVGRRHKEQ